MGHLYLEHISGFPEQRKILVLLKRPNEDMQKNIKVIQNRCECFSEFQKAFGKINRTFEVYLDCFGITLGYYTLGGLGFDLTKKANLFDTLHGNAQHSHNYIETLETTIK